MYFVSKMKLQYIWLLNGTCTGGADVPDSPTMSIFLNSYGVFRSEALKSMVVYSKDDV